MRRKVRKRPKQPQVPVRFQSKNAGYPAKRRGVTPVAILVLCLCLLDAKIALNHISAHVTASRPAEHLNAYETTDTLLRVLSIPHPGALVEKTLRQFPPHSQLLFVTSAEGPGPVFTTLAHLAYPRHLGEIACGGQGKIVDSLESIERSGNIDGVVFYKVKPAAAEKGTQLSPELTIVPHKGPEPWESFCR